MARPSVYFDISIDGTPSGRITFELYNDVVPETAETFAPCAPTRRGSATKVLRSTV